MLVVFCVAHFSMLIFWVFFFCVGCFDYQLFDKMPERTSEILLTESFKIEKCRFFYCKLMERCLSRVKNKSTVYGKVLRTESVKLPLNEKLDY